MISLRFVIFSGYVGIQKQKFRQETLIKSDKAIVRISIPVSQLYSDTKGLEWNDENKELIINGKYFEVVQITSLDGIAQVFLIEDDNENKLFARYFRLKKEEKDNFSLLTSFLFGLSFTSQQPGSMFHLYKIKEPYPIAGTINCFQGHCSVSERPPLVFPNIKAG